MNCYICNNDSFKLIGEKLRYSTERKIYKCDQCGLIFLYPRMTHDEEKQFYEREYGEIFSNEKGTTPAKLFETRLPDARMYFKWVKPYLNKNDNCLELGCASGYFLATIKDQVKNVTGIETHHLLNNYCKKLGLTMIDSLEFCSDNQFDKIFMFFLLEHIGDPTDYLKMVLRVLSKGGYLFIVVPNVEDVLLSLYDIPRFHSFYFTPAHQFYYSKSTLSAVLNKCGFAGYDILPEQRYDLSNHMYWMQYGRPGGSGHYNTIFSKQLLDEYSENLKTHFLCDTLLAIVKK